MTLLSVSFCLYFEKDKVSLQPPSKLSWAYFLNSSDAVESLEIHSRIDFLTLMKTSSAGRILPIGEGSHITSEINTIKNKIYLIFIYKYLYYKYK